MNGKSSKWIFAPVPEEVHTRLKSFCKANRTPMGTVVAGLVEEFLHEVVDGTGERGATDVSEGPPKESSDPSNGAEAHEPSPSRREGNSVGDALERLS